MKDIDTSYKVLGLTPGASEAEIRLAHKNLLDSIYPDLLSPKTTLRKSAREKIAEINEAYDELMLHLAGTSLRNLPAVPPASDIREPQKLEEALPRDAVQVELPPQDNIPPGYIPPVLGVLTLLLCVSLLGISGIGGTMLAIVSAAAGWLAGHALVRGVNKLDAPRLQKSVVAWMAAALFFIVIISLPALSKKPPKRIVSTSMEQAAPKSPRSRSASSPVSNQENEKQGSAPVPGSVSTGGTNPAESASWLSKGKELIIAGKYQEAIDALTRSIQLNPGEAAGYNSRGVAFAYSHQYKKAMDDYNKAIELNPEGDGAYYLNRGIVCVVQGNYQQAIMDYKKAAGLGNKEARDFFDSQNIVW
jgi:DnaJ domain/Tetratricopeptide repeat